MPRSEAEVLVNNGQAVFTTKSRYHYYLKMENKRILTERHRAVKERARAARAKGKKKGPA